MDTPKTPPDKVFKVDKKLVIKSLLPFQIFMVAALLLFLNGFTEIPKTITSSEFWWWVLGIFGVGFAIELWTILYERTEFRGTAMTNYHNTAKTVDVKDFASVKRKKTIYVDYLGFEFKEPKGIFVRFLFPYSLYNPKDLREIMREILKTNPDIKFEDDLSIQIANGTYKSNILG